MKLGRCGVRVLLVGLLLTGCGQKPVDVTAEIGAVNQRLMAAIAAGDGAAAAALYTADGQLLPPASPVLTGREAITAYWQGGIGAGIKAIDLKTREVRGQGDTAHEVGEYRLLAANDLEIDRGKYVVIWKHVDDQWLLHRDIWNTSRH